MLDELSRKVQIDLVARVKEMIKEDKYNHACGLLGVPLADLLEEEHPDCLVYVIVEEDPAMEGDYEVVHAFLLQDQATAYLEKHSDTNRDLKFAFGSVREFQMEQVLIPETDVSIDPYEVFGTLYNMFLPTKSEYYREGN